MPIDVAAEQTALESLATGELVERYAEVCGERSFSRNRVYLVRRILWRMQAQVHGGLSARALERAEELARGRSLGGLPFDKPTVHALADPDSSAAGARRHRGGVISAPR